MHIADKLLSDIRHYKQCFNWKVVSTSWELHISNQLSFDNYWNPVLNRICSDTPVIPIIAPSTACQEEVSDTHSCKTNKVVYLQWEIV